MLDRELAQANEIAQEAVLNLDQFGKELLAEFHRLQARAKCELRVASGKRCFADIFLTDAEPELRTRVVPDKQKVNVVVERVQEFPEAIAGSSKSCPESC